MAPTTTVEISRLDLQGFKTPAQALVTNVKPLSSYSWIEAAKPTIAVPGSPARWSPPRLPRQLMKDSGLLYIAQNAARHPECPLEPLFRALYITQPSFDIRSIDVMTDRNNVRKLLSFVDPSSSRNGLEAFTINIEMVKDTAIFSRDETKTTEFVGPDEFRGYGHEFEKAYTTPKIVNSTGHHRIISYRFGDLTFIIRHETDGYVQGNRNTSPQEARSRAPEDLSSILGELSLSSEKSHGSNTPGSQKVIIEGAPDGLPKPTRAAFGLQVEKGGQEVPLDSTLEIKTRVIHKTLGLQEIIAQLWLSQTPKLVRAYHQRGTFQNPAVEDITSEIKSWELRKQKELRKLAALIRKIIGGVKDCGGKAVLRYDLRGDKLVVSKSERKEMLPEDLYSKWEDRKETKAATSDTRDEGSKHPDTPKSDAKPSKQSLRRGSVKEAVSP
ncbi:hypothetical protein MMC25_006395 [Agyrium rufum]|nr:hypothetical protein [Agyrium rufum]